LGYSQIYFLFQQEKKQAETQNNAVLKRHCSSSPGRAAGEGEAVFLNLLFPLFSLFLFPLLLT
jgi:hypothetical protein